MRSIDPEQAMPIGAGAGTAGAVLNAEEVIEEQREARKNNFDRSIRKQLIADKAITESMALASVSPGSEHLLWLPDLVCSAYRQKLLFQRDELFVEIEELTHVVQLN